ncbi:unnamed protein product [Cunninghamella blakesleeana]
MNDIQPPSNIETNDGFFIEIEELKKQINAVKQNVDKIAELHQSSLVALNDQQWEQMAADIEHYKGDTQKRNMELKKRIKALEASNLKYPKSSIGSSRRDHTKGVKDKFIETVQYYQSVERSFEEKYRQKVERQIRIVKPEATQEEIDEIISSDESPQVFAQSIMQASRRGQARAVLSEVQNRHDDIKKIEKTILELANLFQDMQMMIEQQDEVINEAHQHTEVAVKDAEVANNHIADAIKKARAIRHKKWCCFIICIILAVVIAILVWWFGFGHPGVGGSSNNNNNNNNNGQQ